jgi:NAD-dependent SIR2 family protein deacetylase
VTTDNEQALDRAAAAVRGARALLIGAGAGMGVDSGLPDFRGPEGFWRAYPALRGYRFEEMADPSWFERDPSRAWGFYGHRLNLYRETIPHEGFAILRRWAETRDTFIYTSNVDGQFQRAGFPESAVCECHGSIHHLQDIHPTESGSIWPADGVTVTVDPDQIRAADPLPRSPSTGQLARPNILMFGDTHWLAGRTQVQHDHMQTWGGRLQGPLVVIEIGAGTAIPTVRRTCRLLTQAHGGTLVRINPRESQGPSGTVSLPMGGAAALRAIAERL